MTLNNGVPPAQLVAGGKARYYRFLGQWLPLTSQQKACKLFGLHLLEDSSGSNNNSPVVRRLFGVALCVAVLAAALTFFLPG